MQCQGCHSVPLLLVLLAILHTSYAPTTTPTPKTFGTTTPPPAITAPPCDDLDTLACEQLHKTRPDICSDIYLAEHVCKRYCGNCPLKCYTCSSLVKDMSLCNSITTCDIHEDCYTMEVFDFDTSHGFRGGCIDRNLCVPQGGNEIFGRSTSTVQMKCCDTDNCNSRDLVAPTTTVPPTKAATASHCRDNIAYCSVATPTQLNFFCKTEPHQCRRSCNACLFGKK